MLEPVLANELGPMRRRGISIAVQHIGIEIDSPGNANVPATRSTATALNTASSPPLLDPASRRARQHTSDQPTVADPHQRLVVRELEPEGIGVSVLCPGLVAANLTATSSRNRPDRFGGPMTNARGAPMNPAAMANEDVGPIVARAIAANRAVIFTHDDPRGMLADRFAAYEADQHFLGSS